jgi:acetyltransferase
VAVDREGAAAIIGGALRAGRTMLTEPEAKSLLAGYGIATVETRVARSTAEVEGHAAAILKSAQAVVVKVLSDDISHKSDVGGVRLALASVQEAAKAADDMRDRVARLKPDARLEGFTVQPMIHRPLAHELIVGMTEDLTFGPVLMFGAGGTSVEVVRDTCLGLPPLDLRFARDMIDATRISNLLKGYRDRPPADIAAIADVLIRASQLVIDHPAIRELDINPLLADEAGVIALDARVRVVDPVVSPRRPTALRPYPAEWEATHQIAALEGAITFRPIRPDDEHLYEEFFSHMTLEDTRMRFFSPLKGLSHRFLARLTQIDYAREMAFVAIDASGKLVGVARLSADPDYTRAEYGVVVRSDLKGKGLGWLLMQHLIAYARSEGLAQLYGHVLVENTTMLQMAQNLGFVIERDRDEPGLRKVTLSLK